MYWGGFLKLKLLVHYLILTQIAVKRQGQKRLEREEACDELELGEEKAQTRNGPAFDKEEPDWTRCSWVHNVSRKAVFLRLVIIHLFCVSLLNSYCSPTRNHEVIGDAKMVFQDICVTFLGVSEWACKIILVTFISRPLYTSHWDITLILLFSSNNPQLYFQEPNPKSFPNEHWLQNGSSDLIVGKSRKSALLKTECLRNHSEVYTQPECQGLRKRSPESKHVSPYLKK